MLLAWHCSHVRIKELWICSQLHDAIKCRLLLSLCEPLITFSLVAACRQQTIHILEYHTVHTSAQNTIAISCYQRYIHYECVPIIPRMEQQTSRLHKSQWRHLVN